MTSNMPTPITLNPRDVISPGSIKSFSSTPADNRASYFPQFGLLSPGPPSPAQTDSLSASICLNPDYKFLRSRSSKHSMHSSGQSSIASSSYLTPPEIQPDTDAPPYKSRRRNSNSLTMVKKKTKTTPPEDKWHHKKTSGERNDKRRLTHAEKKSPGYLEQSWRRKSSISSSCEADSKYVCPGKRKAKSKMKNKTSGNLYSSPAAPIETRRWSSVEVGAMPLISSLLPGNSKRSSGCHENLSHQDVVEAVRAKLKTRKLPLVLMETPATITLRKASGAFSVTSSNSSTSPGSVSSLEDLSSNVWRSKDLRKPSAYVVTSAEIDSIANLIEEKLRKSRQIQQIHTPDQSHLQCQAPVHRPSVCNGFISIQNVAPADVATTLSDIHVGYAANDERRDSENTLSPRRTSSGLAISQIHSATSIHEIVWEGVTSRPTLKSVMSHSQTEGFSYERTYSMYDTSTPGTRSPGTSWITKISSGRAKNEYLSPLALATPLIETSFEWSESKPQEPYHDTDQTSSQHSDAETITQNAIPVIVTDEDSRSEQSGSPPSSKASPTRKGSKTKMILQPGSHKKAERVQNPFISAVTKDVISFPALPSRQKTSDWISPLPDMSAPIQLRIPEKLEAANRRKTLYDMGLDITQSCPITEDDDHELFHDQNTAPKPLKLHSRSTESLNLDNRRARYHGNGSPDHKTQRKSIVFQHPATEMMRDRSDSKGGMGKAIGISSGRRRSSGYALKNSPNVATSSDKNASRRGRGSIVRALMGSRSEADFRRKSLSQHGGGQRVKIMVEPDEADRACVDHAWAKLGVGEVWREKGKGKTGNDDFHTSGPRLEFMDFNAIPNDISKLSPPRHSPRSTPIQSSSNSSYPFPPFTPSPTSSPNPANPKSTIPLKSLKSSLHNTKKSRRGMSADRLSLIEEKSSASVQEDCVGVYITMTGTRRDGEGLGGAKVEGGDPSSLCSVGCEDHNCDEDVDRTG